jgi:acyl-CoA reductase-like NAD-dependent aldehyde dehydrogenase
VNKAAAQGIDPPRPAQDIASAGQAGADAARATRDALRAVELGQAAFSRWSALSFRERRAHLKALRHVLRQHTDAIVQVVGKETGKPAADIVQAEALHAGLHLGYTLRHAEQALRERRAWWPWPLVTKSARVSYRPYGVAAVVTPANHPFLLPFLGTVSALAAGCTAIIKPHPLTPRSADLVLELAQTAGLPEHTVQVVHGGAIAGAALLEAGVDVVALTGSSGTGRTLQSQAARLLIPTICELGGNDPMLVLDGANLKRAARAAVWGAFFNAGQNCVAVERVYVLDHLHDRFLVELTEQLRHVTAAGSWRTDIGPLIDPHHAGHLEAQLDDALQRGARMLTGGRWKTVNGRVYLEPTVLTDVTPDMSVICQETFGPVLPIMRVATTDQAIAESNSSPYGLHASLWTGDTARGHELAGRLRTGAVAINDCLVNYAIPSLPFGGVGASGTGRQGGHAGLRSYCYTQTITAARFDPPRESHWFPRRIGANSWRTVARLLP